MRVICFTGVGGTGKTVVNKLLTAKYPDIYVNCGSIVREFYKFKGINNEKDFLDIKNNKDKFEFQVDLIKFYMDNMIIKILNWEKTDKILLFDRSIYDHLAYIHLSNQSEIDNSLYETFIKNEEFFNFLIKIKLVYFPFPTAWDYKEGEDGFRHRSYGKDFVVDAIICKYLNKQVHLQLTNSSTPEERALLIHSFHHDLVVYI